MLALMESGVQANCEATGAFFDVSIQCSYRIAHAVSSPSPDNTRLGAQGLDCCS